MFYEVPQHFIKSKSLPKTEPSIIDLMELYSKNNPESGYIVFQVVQNSPIHGMKPIQDAKVTISKEIGNGYFVSKVVTTDINGKTTRITLPTPKAYRSLSPEEEILYSTYNATVEASNYLTTDIFDIIVFDNITSIQTIQLLPGQSNGAHQVYNSNPQNLCDEW